MEFLLPFLILPISDTPLKMSGGRWKQVRAALAQIGAEAMQYDVDGVDMCFINSPLNRELIKVGRPFLPFIVANKHNQTQAEIFGVYDQVRPRGASSVHVLSRFDLKNPLGTTPTGAKLERILGRIIEMLNHAVDTPAYGRIKPVDIIVLTDGEPTDDPASVIQAAARKLNEGLHHPNAVGIQFLQIGNEEGADKKLRALCDGPVRVSSLFLQVLAFGGLILFSYREWLTLFLM